jgi:hypothetical protein
MELRSHNMIRLRKEEDVAEELKRQHRPYRYPNPSPEQAKEAEHHRIDIERFSKMQYMSFVIPSSGQEVQINLTEEPPMKPRLTWLLVSCVQMLAYIQGGDPSPGMKVLIGADDKEYNLTASDWIALLHELGNHLQTNIQTAVHMKGAVDGAGRIRKGD